MSSAEWKGEILLEEDVWPGMEEEQEDVEIYNLAHQPRKWSSSSMAVPASSSPYPFRSGRLSLPVLQVPKEKDVPKPRRTQSDSLANGSRLRTSSSSSNSSNKAMTNSLYSDLMLHLRPRSTSPRPRSTSTSRVTVFGEPESSSFYRGRDNKRLSTEVGFRARSRSYHGEDHNNVPCGVLVDIAD